jgi:hypothetical protein
MLQKIPICDFLLFTTTHWMLLVKYHLKTIEFDDRSINTRCNITISHNRKNNTTTYLLLCIIVELLQKFGLEICIITVLTKKHTTRPYQLICTTVIGKHYPSCSPWVDCYFIRTTKCCGHLKSRATILSNEEWVNNLYENINKIMRTSSSYLQSLLCRPVALAAHPADQLLCDISIVGGLRGWWRSRKPPIATIWLLSHQKQQALRHTTNNLCSTYLIDLGS